MFVFINTAGNEWREIRWGLLPRPGKLICSLSQLTSFSSPVFLNIIFKCKVNVTLPFQSWGLVKNCCAFYQKYSKKSNIVKYY